MTSHTITGTIVRVGPSFSISAATTGPAGPAGIAGADAYVRPDTTAGTPAVEVTVLERTAVDLDAWPDGCMGFVWNVLEDAIYGTGPNSGDNAVWEVAANGDLLGTVVDDAIPTAGLKDADTNYAAGGGLYQTDAGLGISVYHGEEAAGPGDDPLFTYWSFIGLLAWRSGTPTDCGRIVTPQAAKDDPDVTTNVEVAGGTFAIHDGYFHVFYRETVSDGTKLNLSVARCELADLETIVTAGNNVPNFTKWDGSDWTEPGIGGAGAELLTDMPTGFTVKWCDVVWLAESECWCLVYSYSDGDDWGIACRFSTDLIRWSTHRVLVAPTAVETIYVTATAPLTLQSAEFDQRNVPGSDLWVFFTSSVNGDEAPGRWADATVNKLVVQVRSPFGVWEELDALTATVDALPGDISEPEDWTTVGSLSNSWTVVTGGTVRYYAHLGRGHLHLPVVTGGASGSVLFTLPAGYRPDSFEVFQCWSTADNTSFAGASVGVNTDGTVQVFWPDGTKPVVLGGAFSWRIP